MSSVIGNFSFMPFYSYLVRNRLGENLKGIVDAPSLELASEALREKGFIIISLKRKERSFWYLLTNRFLNRITAKDIVLFSRQLAVMAGATLPLVQSLQILGKQTDNLNLKLIIADITNQVEGGAKLSTAFEKHPQVFSHFYINMIRSGETSGRLDEVLNYLADQEEKDYDLTSRIKGAMIYPAFIFGGLILVAAVMMIFVIPQLTRVLAESQQALPVSTQLLVFTSNFLVSYWWVILAVVVILIVSWRLTLQFDFGRRYWDAFKLHFPLIGELLQKIYLTRLTRSLGTLLRGGIPLTQSLKVASNVVSNRTYQLLIAAVVKEVEDGNPLALLFQQSKVVPPMVSQMMAVGEQTGQLDKILERVTDFYSREIENSINNLVTLIEPIIMIVMGVAVGLMVAAIILPLYNLASAI